MGAFKYVEHIQKEYGPVLAKRFIPRMCKVPSGHLLSIDAFYSIQRFC